MEQRRSLRQDRPLEKFVTNYLNKTLAGILDLTMSESVQVPNGLSLLEENYREKRTFALKRLRIFASLSIVLSVVSACFGVWNIIVVISEEKHDTFPYLIPIGLIAGVLGLIPSATAVHLARQRLRHEATEKKSRRSLYVIYKRQILIIFVTAVLNFLFLLLCCAGSAIGLYMCATDHSNCDDYRSSKYAISIAVLVLSLGQWLFSFFYSRWYFVYSRAFGFKSKIEKRNQEMKALELQKRAQNQTADGEAKRRAENENVDD